MSPPDDAALPPGLPPAAVLDAWGIGGLPLAPLGRGLINSTWRVNGPDRAWVLQRLNPIFPAVVNEDIAAVTAHLRAGGLVTPELLRTREDSLWVEQGGGVWRLMTLVPGIAHDRLASPAQAESAGELLARFHRALDGLRHEFRSTRPAVHDTPRHLRTLRDALAGHRDHLRYDRIAPLAAEILAMAADLPPLPAFAPRIVHGDPKINNILFADDGITALCLVDLDTLGPMALPLELGDAFRSWCNPAGEDAAAAEFDVGIFAAAVRGYATAARGWILSEELAAIVPAVLTIYVELAARFAADALNESYFGWDPTRFASRSEHNEVRARSQLAAARSLLARRTEAEDEVARLV